MSRAVVMSFSAAAVWRIRRAAPLLPTVLLGDTSRVLRTPTQAYTRSLLEALA